MPGSAVRGRHDGTEKGNSLSALISPAAGSLYDARRGVYYTKPLLRGWLHLLWFTASLAAGPLLLVGTHGTAQITAVAVYAASVSALFGTSALYHRGTWTAPGGSACSAWTTR